VVKNGAIVTTHPSLHPITATSRTISNLADHLLGMDSNGMVTNQVPGVHAPAPGALPIEAGKATEATIHGKMEITNLMEKDVAKGKSKVLDRLRFPNMMPQYPQPMMQPPLPPPMIDKGAGKGVVPPPPMMPPSTLAHAVPTMPWGPLGQTMPMQTAPTCSSMTPEPATTYRQDGPAQQKLNRLLKEMKKEEDNLPPHLQSIAHEMQKQDEKNSIKTLS